MDIWSFIGVGFVCYIAFIFIKRLGQGLPILELMLLIAGLQWIIGPLIEYGSPNLHFKYYMYVDQFIYMSFVVPAYIIFSVAVILMIKKTANINLNVERLQFYSPYGLIIFIIGIIFDVFGSFLPGALGFFAFILANFKFVGAIILFYSENLKLKKIFYIAILYLLAVSISKALFHDFILWSVFFYMFWALKYKPSISKILLTIVIGFLAASTLQTIKAVYRTQIYEDYTGNKLELFVSLMFNAFLVDETTNENFDDGTDSNVRLNQGWIISAIMDHIPKNRSYLNGSTVKDAIFSSALPRFLNPSKTTAGGRENFRDFTGLSLRDGTSMGISIVGEAYGNFAVTGGILFMGLWGLFLGRIWKFLFQRIIDNIVFIAFIPLIFLQVIKAETELVVVLNHLIKSIIVVFLFLWFVKRKLNWNFDR
ncbi:hypothetical protein ES711_04980 [Gelidibacter salicanalis]|uniref:Oligosaccharide repeat unit polymerase n=1 Tax=Gelidibacter salicanalis TaxID=291193 RepID=A0A5C7AS05_9FLAO|nr:hypothetical protein [Gelidibacter salicanalis]TXE09285.1 hypothetical protein ES711_04980 [Gelidibacter salicanalis]